MPPQRGERPCEGKPRELIVPLSRLFPCVSARRSVTPQTEGQGSRPQLLHHLMNETNPPAPHYRICNTMQEAARYGQIARLRELLPTAPPAERTEALYAAALGKHVRCMQLLLDNGADARLALPYARSVGGIRLLLAAGAEVEAVDAHGRTALWHNAAKGKLERVRLLLSAGADMHRADAHGVSPVWEALYRNQDAVVVLFMEHGATPDLRNPAGTSLSTMALRHRLSRTMRMCRG